MRGIVKLLSANTCYVPHDLSQVIRSKDEVSAELGGMSHAQVDKIWTSVESLYRTGNYPLITLCLRRKGEILINRSIGHAQEIRLMVRLPMLKLEHLIPQSVYFQLQKWSLPC